MKTKNILILMMLLVASLGTVNATLISGKAANLPSFLQPLKLIPYYGSLDVWYDCESTTTCSMVNPLSTTSKFTGIWINAQLPGSSFYASPMPAPVTVQVGNWGTVTTTVSTTDKFVIVPLTTSPTAGQKTVPVTFTITSNGAPVTETQTYTINGVNGVYGSTPTPTVTATATPTVTATATPPKPAPVIIPPAISRLLEAIWSSIKGFFGLSIIGGQSVNLALGNAYTTQMTLNYASPDSDYSDGSYQAKFAEWFVADASGKILSESGWSQQLTGTSWNANPSYTPTASGKIYLIGVVVKQQYTYGSTGWTVVETVETKEVQEVVVSIPGVVTKTPTTTSASIFASFFAWLKGLFGWV